MFLMVDEANESFCCNTGYFPVEHGHKSLCKMSWSRNLSFSLNGFVWIQPNAYTYSYIAKGLCEKGKVGQGLKFYKEMRNREWFLAAVHMWLRYVVWLWKGKSNNQLIEVVFYKLDNSLSPFICWRQR